MSTCIEFEAWMQEIAAGTAPAEVEEAARRHGRECRECGALLVLHEELATLEGRAELIPEALLSRARGGVLASLVVERRARAAARPAALRWWQTWTLRPAAAAAAVLLLLAAGFGSGLLFTRLRPAEEVTVAGLVQKAARGTTQLSDVENSRYQFSNVSFRDAGASRIGLSFDVTTHVETTAERSDPVVKSLLIQSLLNPSPVGSRLKAMDVAEVMRDTAVKQALIVALLNDSSVAVRLKAQEVLSSYPVDEEIQSAYLQVLRGDASVEMRLQAIEYFMNLKVRPAALADVLRDLKAKDDTPVLLRASRYVQ